MNIIYACVKRNASQGLFPSCSIVQMISSDVRTVSADISLAMAVLLCISSMRFFSFQRVISFLSHVVFQQLDEIQYGVRIMWKLLCLPDCLCGKELLSSTHEGRQYLHAWSEIECILKFQAVQRVSAVIYVTGFPTSAWTLPSVHISVLPTLTSHCSPRPEAIPFKIQRTEALQICTKRHNSLLAWPPSSPFSNLSHWRHKYIQTNFFFLNPSKKIYQDDNGFRKDIL